MAEGPLLSVRQLEKHYPVREGLLRREDRRVRAVDGISFSVRTGETIGLVGESGCGKSTAARALLRLEEPTGGMVVFGGEDIGEFNRTELKRLRRRVQMIFQDPRSTLDPRMTIGEAIGEPLLAHGLHDPERRRHIVEDMLNRVGLSGEKYDRYPHEFSGGQCQRIALARALVLNPDLLVADEPVSALDVSVQAEILALLDELRTEFDLSMIVISHDLGVVKQVCDRIAVMYAGEIVEIGVTAEIFDSPQHPYTQALLGSIPHLDPRERGRATGLTGDVPDSADPPVGCRFHPRCPAVIQPEGHGFEQEKWRSIMDLRVQVANHEIDLDTHREIIAAESDVETRRKVTNEQLRTALRREYDLPSDLSTEAETVLSAALDDLVAGNLEAADARLSEAFTTVCEERHPSLQKTGIDHLAACHLHDERTAE